MPRLIHLNGPPGIGKSTLARRYVTDHPGTLVCDVDVLRTFIGGWADDFEATGGLIRPAALALIAAYLEHGHDVVLPQLLGDPLELARFEAAAGGAGAEFVEVFLTAPVEEAIDRFDRRGVDEPDDPWHDQVRSIVAAQGGRAALVAVHAALRRRHEERPDACVVESDDGDVEATYQRLLMVLDASRDT